MPRQKHLDRITKRQIYRQNLFRRTQKKGQLVSCFGKEFIVYPDVFWPFEDSTPLIKKMRIKKGERVLDVCTGTGIIAVLAALKGAKRVIAVDINPNAVKAAKANAKKFGVQKKVEVRHSDMLSAIKKYEKFDVITGNLPFRNKKARDFAAATQWDTGLHCHKELFKHAKQHLTKNGRMYLVQASFGAVNEMKSLAKESGFKVKLLSRMRTAFDRRSFFYDFELAQLKNK